MTLEGADADNTVWFRWGFLLRERWLVISCIAVKDTSLIWLVLIR